MNTSASKQINTMKNEYTQEKQINTCIFCSEM
jgi:hypothetical protein